MWYFSKCWFSNVVHELIHEIATSQYIGMWSCSASLDKIFICEIDWGFKQTRCSNQIVVAELFWLIYVKKEADNLITPQKLGEWSDIWLSKNIEKTSFKWISVKITNYEYILKGLIVKKSLKDPANCTEIHEVK